MKLNELIEELNKKKRKFENEGVDVDNIYVLYEFYDVHSNRWYYNEVTDIQHDEEFNILIEGE